MTDDRRNDHDPKADGPAARDAIDADGAPVDGAPVDGAQVDTAHPQWSNLWQIPTIALSLTLIAAALMLTRSGDTTDEYEVALRQAEQMVEQRLLADAEPLLRDTLQPELEAANEDQTARFHQLVADWLSLKLEEDGVQHRQTSERIVEQYTLARERGLRLGPERLERFANALIATNNLDDARQVLPLLDAFDDGRKGEVDEIRGRIFRRLVEHRIARAGAADRGELMALLEEYRRDRQDELDDLVWIIARQAEIRLNSNDTREAIERLLVDLRRIEYQQENHAGPMPDLGELYTLLGRGYYDLGQYQSSAFNLNRALELFTGGDAVRGDALVLLGRIAFAEGRFDAASDFFHEVVEHYHGTRSHLPGMLGMAEATSVLGLHDESRAAYRRLAQQREQIDQHPAMTRRDVAASLVDRHDAAIAVSDLDLALSYIKLAEAFFNRPDVPSDVLFRIAATSRQIADNLMAAKTAANEAGSDAGGEHQVAAGAAQSPMEIRRRANELYQQAGEYFIRHARAMAGSPTEADAWAESLWLGADAFDHGGLYELAIRHLQEYLAGRSQQDPRRAQVNFRLAQAHHALREFEEAARHYRQVIDEHPRSIEATRGYVPLARALVALDRRSEAEDLLSGVLAGRRPIQPDAADFRDALIELGTIAYHGGNYRTAIERLDEAVKRYPDDPRHIELVFRLADSYRRMALEIVDRLRDPSAESPGERRRLSELRERHLASAFELFDQICDTLSRRDQRTLEPAHREILRGAYLYRADAAFGLGRYEQAIQLYDQAARRYADHHSSMHALVQIVNAYNALGDEERAQAAHRRALSRLQQLRDEAFNAPDAIMDRQAWERWLEHTPVGPTRIGRATE